jgi:hypothetical protein
VLLEGGFGMLDVGDPALHDGCCCIFIW